MPVAGVYFGVFAALAVALPIAVIAALRALERRQLARWADAAAGVGLKMSGTLGNLSFEACVGEVFVEIHRKTSLGYKSAPVVFSTVAWSRGQGPWSLAEVGEFAPGDLRRLVDDALLRAQRGTAPA